ncbi:MAG: patatin-like phospholipase family protein, partial [Cyanobacteria bacterium P01_A01_bin.17]
MSAWNPSEVNVSHLTEEEVAFIQTKLPSVKGEDGTQQYYADAVFEGGGVKGTAFLGALRCFDDAGIQFRKVAGTSAGAITAAMV